MILALLVACASRAPLGEAFVGDVPAPADYDAAVRDATRELRLYEGLATTLLLRAVWLDADLRDAVEGERAHLLLLGPTERAEKRTASLAEAEVAHVFVFSADAQDREALAFGAGEDAAWRVRAFAGGAPCTPVSVERLSPTPMDARLYPFHTRWSTLWAARFSSDCGRASPIVLQFTGPRGAGELGWRTALDG